MGVQPKLEDIEAMEEDPPPLSEIKTGLTPTTTVTSAELIRDFSRYEDLDTPTPLRSSDLMAYTRHEPTASTSTAPIHPPATRMFTHRPGYEHTASVSHSRPTYTMMEQDRSPFYPPQPQQQPPHPSQSAQSFPPSRPSYPQAMDMPDSASATTSYNFQFYSMPSATASQVPHTAPVPPIPSSAVYAPLQTVRLGTHGSFDQTATTCEHFDVLISRRSVSVPQTLSCCETPPYMGSSMAPTPSQANPSYSSMVKEEPYEYPVDIRRSSCSSIMRGPRRSLPTPSSSSSVAAMTAAGKEKQFVCLTEGCEKRFARVDELKRHQRTHSDIRPYTCNICDKGFTRSDHLITHRRTHTGEKPYPCPHCERCFARSDERSRHVKTHTNPRQGTSTRGRRPSTKFPPRRQPTPQQQPAQSSLQPQGSFSSQLEPSGASSDASYSQGDTSYNMYQQ